MTSDFLLGMLSRVALNSTKKYNGYIFEYLSLVTSSHFSFKLLCPSRLSINVPKEQSIISTEKDFVLVQCIRSYLAQSTLVFGCGIITYTDPVLPVSGFVISLGHMIKGFGKSVSHFGKSFFQVAVFFEQVVDFRPLSVYPWLHEKVHFLPPGCGLVAHSGGLICPFSRNAKGSQLMGSQLPKCTFW